MRRACARVYRIAVMRRAVPQFPGLGHVPHHFRPHLALDKDSPTPRPPRTAQISTVLHARSAHRQPRAPRDTGTSLAPCGGPAASRAGRGCACQELCPGIAG
jgi:hypothetical protein